MKNSNDSLILGNVEAESTFVRRTSTIVGWKNWMLSIIEE